MPSRPSGRGRGRGATGRWPAGAACGRRPGSSRRRRGSSRRGPAAGQCEAVADGLAPGIAALQRALEEAPGGEKAALQEELAVAEAAAIHMRSTANVARFVLARDALARATNAGEAQPRIALLDLLL